MDSKVRLVGGSFKGEFEKIEVNRLFWTTQTQQRQERWRQIVLTWAEGGAVHLFASQLRW